MDYCENCPLAGSGKRCIAVDHARYCELIAMGREDYRGYVYARSIEGPNLLDQAVSFGKAVVSHVMAGMPNVSETEKEHRLSICRSCPKFDAEGGTCRVCGCAMALKASWGLSECPEGKWTSQAT